MTYSSASTAPSGRPSSRPTGHVTDVAMRELAEDGWVPDDLRRSQWGEPHVAPDGSLWVPSRLGVMER